MDGLFYLMSVAGVGVVMWWLLQNDRVPPDGPTTGIFAMLPGYLLAKRRRLRDWRSTPAAAPKPRRSALD